MSPGGVEFRMESSTRMHEFPKLRRALKQVFARMSRFRSFAQAYGRSLESPAARLGRPGAASWRAGSARPQHAENKQNNAR